MPNPTPTQEQITEMLETVIDPELGVDVWTMGLIYNVTVPKDKQVDILMTFTTPFCPYGEQLKDEVEDSMKILGFEKVNIEVTFDPPWTPPKELREAMGV